MIGIDGEFAHLQKVRAGLSVKQKKTTANSFEENVAELKAFASEMIFGSNQKAMLFA